jgi:hypothetical protein
MIKFFIHLLIIGLVIGSCNQELTVNKVKKPIVLNSELNKSAEVEYEEKVFYTLPSPFEEMSQFAKMDGLKKLSLLTSIHESDSLRNNIGNAFFLGAYCSDVAYLAVHNEIKHSLLYLNEMHTIGKELNFDSTFLSNFSAGINRCKYKSDSINFFGDFFYKESYLHLLNREFGGEVSFFMLGKWIESMHLILNSSRGFQKSPKINQYISGQKVVTENLMGFLLDYQDIKLVAEFTSKLGDILGLYDEMECDFSPTVVVAQGSRLRLKGGSQCIMNEELFLSLTNMIDDIRNQLFQINLDEKN